jgi:pimeloyl-ACP methyl ester carboxylesterase
MSVADELDLVTPNGRFAALAWRNPGAPRVICLHGWLDNAASFVPLAPLLGDLDLVALDFAGHGHSAHRPRGTRYYMMDNIWDVDAVLDELGWAECCVMGHSLGGVVACAYAAAAPGRVQRLVAIDGLGPLSAGANRTAARLRKSLKSVRNASGRLREFESIEHAISARRNVSDLSAEAARLICERSLEHHGDHYRWRTDPALNWHSPVLMTEEQVLDVLAAIEAPALSITALPLNKWIDAETARNRVEAIPDCRSHTIEGHHHFHMETPQDIARLILDFLKPTESLHEYSQA